MWKCNSPKQSGLFWFTSLWRRGTIYAWWNLSSPPVEFAFLWNKCVWFIEAVAHRGKLAWQKRCFTIYATCSGVDVSIARSQRENPPLWLNCQHISRWLLSAPKSIMVFESCLTVFTLYNTILKLYSRSIWLQQCFFPHVQSITFIFCSHRLNKMHKSVHLF